jgi:hypothetical protein
MDIVVVVGLLGLESLVQSLIILKILWMTRNHCCTKGSELGKTETVVDKENTKELTVRLWAPIENAKVQVRSMREMKDYLERHIVKFGSLYVHSFKIDVPNRTVWLRYHDGESLKKVFFGYIYDVAYNIQRGFYEQSTPDQK